MALPDWNVSPGPARAVIQNLRDDRSGFPTKEDSLQSAVEDAAVSSQSTLITGALQATYENYLAPVAAVAKLTVENVANRGEEMVNAFVNADMAMAIDARGAIDDVPSSPEDAQ